MLTFDGFWQTWGWRSLPAESAIIKKNSRFSSSFRWFPVSARLEKNEHCTQPGCEATLLARPSSKFQAFKVRKPYKALYGWSKKGVSGCVIQILQCLWASRLTFTTGMITVYRIEKSYSTTMINVHSNNWANHSISMTRIHQRWPSVQSPKNWTEPEKLRFN